MFDGSPSNPFGYPSTQFKRLGGVAWRWVLASTVGMLSGFPVLSLLLGLILFAHLFRKDRTVEFWRPYGILSNKFWLVRLGTVLILTIGLWNSADDVAGQSITFGWVAAGLVWLMESFLVRPTLMAMKEDQ